MLSIRVHSKAFIYLELSIKMIPDLFKIWYQNLGEIFEFTFYVISLHYILQCEVHPINLIKNVQSDSFQYTCRYIMILDRNDNYRAYCISKMMKAFHLLQSFSNIHLFNNSDKYCVLCSGWFSRIFCDLLIQESGKMKRVR